MPQFLVVLCVATSLVTNHFQISNVRTTVRIRISDISLLSISYSTGCLILLCFESNLNFLPYNCIKNSSKNASGEVLSLKMDEAWLEFLSNSIADTKVSYKTLNVSKRTGLASHVVAQFTFTQKHIKRLEKLNYKTSSSLTSIFVLKESVCSEFIVYQLKINNN